MTTTTTAACPVCPPLGWEKPTHVTLELVLAYHDVHVAAAAAPRRARRAKAARAALATLPMPAAALTLAASIGGPAWAVAGTSVVLYAVGATLTD